MEDRNFVLRISILIIWIIIYKWRNYVVILFFLRDDKNDVIFAKKFLPDKDLVKYFLRARLAGSTTFSTSAVGSPFRSTLVGISFQCNSLGIIFLNISVGISFQKTWFGISVPRNFIGNINESVLKKACASVNFMKSNDWYEKFLDLHCVKLSDND